jgi:uncharacterized protein
MEYEQDSAKAAVNFKKHKVRFSYAALALEDLAAWTISDPDGVSEERFICLASDPTGRILVTVFTHRGTNIRINLSRKASRAERLIYENLL